MENIIMATFFPDSMWIGYTVICGWTNISLMRDLLSKLEPKHWSYGL